MACNVCPHFELFKTDDRSSSFISFNGTTSYLRTSLAASMLFDVKGSLSCGSTACVWSSTTIATTEIRQLMFCWNSIRIEYSRNSQVKLCSEQKLFNCKNRMQKSFRVFVIIIALQIFTCLLYHLYSWPFQLQWVLKTFLCYHVEWEILLSEHVRIGSFIKAIAAEVISFRNPLHDIVLMRLSSGVPFRFGNVSCWDAPNDVIVPFSLKQRDTDIQALCTRFSWKSFLGI